MKIGSYNFAIDLPKLATRQIDNVEDVNFKGSRNNHRVNFQYNKDLERNVVRIVDNSTGETVKQTPTEAQVDHEIRINRLIGLHLDIYA